MYANVQSVRATIDAHIGIIPETDKTNTTRIPVALCKGELNVYLISDQANIREETLQR